MSNKKGFYALSPLLVFVVLYFATAIIVGDFRKVPITVPFMLASIYAVSTSGGFSLAKRIEYYSRGAGARSMMLMLWIFVLAGAFANTAKVMGSIDATVTLTLNILPSNMLLAGMFLSACLISVSVGTSVGTILALMPIAAAVTQSTGMSTPLMAAAIVGGAFFGDNLSFISDTTVAATQTQGCKMSDKFRANLFIVLPAALGILLTYFIMGLGMESQTPWQEVDWVRVVPYVVVLLTAVAGMNVLAVLSLGLMLTGIIGLHEGVYDFVGWFAAMNQGILGMGELIIITMMAGGLLEIIRKNGGIDYIIDKLTARVTTKRGAELSIAALVALVDLFTANNTVAILTVGSIAKNISDKFDLDPRKVASILDTFSCFMQGIIPYGAQILMAAALAHLNPVEILPYLYYPYAIGLVALLAILLRRPKRYS